jgi:hypothetical protein
MYFISYSTKDTEKITSYLEQIKNRLGKENVWYAPEKIKESKFYVKEISNAINDSKGIILFLSKNSIVSNHVKREINLAISKGIDIFPLRIEEIELNEEWEYFLGIVQWIDVFKDDNFKKFLDNLLKIEIKLNEDEFVDFCIYHFEKMGYKVIKKNEFLEVRKNNIYFKVSPIYREKLDIKGFRAIETELFWKYRDLILKKEILEVFFKEYKFKENPTFKQKQLFLQQLKYNKNKKENIIFYLYIKNPPSFYKTNFKIGFINEDKYKEKETLPQFFLNSTYIPAWWGVGRDNLETIKGERYKNITSSINEAYKELKNNTNKKMESYNGRLAESFCEVFFRNNGYLVQKFGIENVLGNTLKLVNMYNKELKNKNDLFKYMTLPDFLVMKIDKENNLQDNFLVDAKFRHYYSKKEFYKDLKDGDIKSQAQKYNNFWGNIFLFIIADFGDEVEIYFDKVENILAGKIKNIKEYNFKNNEIKKLYSYVKTIWENI